MKQVKIYQKENVINSNDTYNIEDAVQDSFNKIAPFWPLENLIAVNPLQGLEDFPFEEALKMAANLFEIPKLPQEMHNVNRETIKWLQVYFDEGQSTIEMPLKQNGLYSALKELIIYDSKLHNNDKQKQQWLAQLPKNSKHTIAECLLRLSIPKEKRSQFLTTIITSLSGWSSYIKYLSTYKTQHQPYQEDYIAIRLIITCLLWPEARVILKLNDSTNHNLKDSLLSLEANEKSYRISLLTTLAAQKIQIPRIPEAQMVFCIDTRSEPLRRALESSGNYQTFGFAGFFGIPMEIIDNVTNESYNSCPVLIPAKHTIKTSVYKQGIYQKINIFKHLYQALKYNFITPFGLVEAVGLISGICLAVRNFTPRIVYKYKKSIMKLLRSYDEKPNLSNISLQDKCSYALNALKMIGLTDNFAPVVIFCGHGSSTENNPYATALNCGACAGRHGLHNAIVIAEILNQYEVRNSLASNGIIIPQATIFLAAQHNTTTDEVEIHNAPHHLNLAKIRADLEKAKIINSCTRALNIQQKKIGLKGALSAIIRSANWAEVRPEWGLARNAAFIIAPRDISTYIDLEGRCFLHSYDYQKDLTGEILTNILTAPMIVAEWINTQYLFSTLNNITYGSGSKITQNITGKIGVMQGNASDLMTGLPLQSIYSSDSTPYHELQRLMTVVFAPLKTLDYIISSHKVLQKLFGNGWMQLAVITPNDRKIFLLNRDFTWKIINEQHGKM